MSNEFAHFRNTQTGKIVKLPRHYDGLFDTLELTDEDVECTDCNTPDTPEDEEAAEIAQQPEETPIVASTGLSLTEPAKRERRR